MLNLEQAVLWCTESFTLKSSLEEHSQWITDVRFSPSMSWVATSSADRTVRVWDVDNVSNYCIFLFFFNPESIIILILTENISAGFQMSSILTLSSKTST